MGEVCRQVVSRQVNWQFKLKNKGKREKENERRLRDSRKGNGNYIHSAGQKLGLPPDILAVRQIVGQCRGEVLWGLRLVEKLLPLLR